MTASESALNICEAYYGQQLEQIMGFKLFTIQIEFNLAISTNETSSRQQVDSLNHLSQGDVNPE